MIGFTRINNDKNGNPRYVCHFINLTLPSESTLPIHKQYELAIKRANTIGGRKYHNKRYGGGIVFQSYNILETERHILKLTQQK